MTNVKLDKLGMPGAVYRFSGTIRKLVLATGEEIRLNTDPWKLKAEQLVDISIRCDMTVGDLENIFLELHDSMQVTKPIDTTRTGKNSEAVVNSWEDAIKRDAKGTAIGLNTEAIAILMAPGHARIDDVVFKVENNIGEMLSEEKLKIQIIRGLKTVGAADLYSLTTAKLVRDQMLPIVQETKLCNLKGMIPVKNGILSVTEGRLVNVDGIVLKTLNTVFDPDRSDCTRIKRLIWNMFEKEQREMVLSIIGAAISGAPAPYILALSGSGRNGKSILREILEKMMVSLITTERIENLHKDFVNAAFLGARISWQTEVDSSHKFVGKIKDITGGTTIQVRRKFINGELQYPLQMVCIMDTNDPPHLDNSPAINKRLRFVNMPHLFVAKDELTGDPREVLQDLTLMHGWEDEFPAFLNLLLPYAKFFVENGYLEHDIKGTGSQLRDRSNALSAFIDTNCDLADPNFTVCMTTFYTRYGKYTEKINIACPEIDQLRYKLKHEYSLKIVGNTIHGLSLRKQPKLESE